MVLVASAQALPGLPALSFSEGIALLQSVIPTALCLSLLLSLSYAGGQQHLRTAPALLCLFILASLYPLGMAKGLDYLKALPVSLTLTGKGVPFTAGTILATPAGPVIIFNNPEEKTVSYVEAFPWQRLSYHEGSLPLLFPFADRSVSRLTEGFLSIRQQFEQRLRTDLLSAAVYNAALVLALISLYGVFKISAWPSVNVCLGAGAFGGFLIFNPILNKLSVFLTEKVPALFIEPLVLSLLAFTIILCTSVVHLFIKRKSV
jgi:hypothetical protein